MFIENTSLLIKLIGSDGRVFKYKKGYDISYFAWKKNLNEKEKNGFSLAEKRFNERFGEVHENFGLQIKAEVKVENSQNK